MTPEHPEISRDGGEFDPIDIVAAQWLVRRDRGLSVAEEQEFTRWLRQDERHAQSLAELEKTWSLLERVPAACLPTVPRRKWPGVRTFGCLAAAAGIVMAFFIAGAPHNSTVALTRTLSTAVGGLEKIKLPDGSMVRLNTATVLNVAFSARERRVQLTSGEANFVVAHDETRPFIVSIGAVDVRAVGTAFNIRQQSDTLEVLVTEGKVRVSDAFSGKSLLAFENTSPVSGNTASNSRSVSADQERSIHSPLLAAGQRVRILNKQESAVVAANIVSVAPEEVARALAWQNRRLEFSLEPLENVVAEFNRYNRHQLVIADPQLAMQRFGGKFPANDFDTFVQVLEASFNVVAERHKNETVLRLRP
jgi:transmembrane sensor